MDFLQIRDSNPLTDWERKCVSQLKSIMLPEDTYEFIRIPDYDNIVSTVNASDLVRFEWLRSHPNGVYVDTDCFVKTRWCPPDDGLPYFPRNESFGHPDIFFIYVNGNTGFFEENFSCEIRNRYIEENVDSELIKEFYGWPKQLMDDLVGFGWIPESLYLHKYLSMKREIERRDSMAKDVKDVVAEVSEALDRAKVSIYDMKNLCYELTEKLNSVIKENESLKKQLDVKPEEV